MPQPNKNSLIAYFALLEVGMQPEARLAVLARSVQWKLDEAAFELGGGRYTLEQRQQLAGELVALAEELCGGDVHTMIISSETA